MATKTLLVIAGPTAVGKTDSSVRLAKEFGADIVSADSRQLYRELTIGTAKPTVEEMQGVRHHFIDSHSVMDSVSAGRYGREALAVLETLFEEKDVVLLSGGTGLYINAVCFGLDDIPVIDPALRAELQERLEREGIGPLRKELQRLDPLYATTADLQNTQRVLRALEVTLGSGQPFSSYRKTASQELGKGKSPVLRPFRMIFIALERPREVLYERIDWRMDQMLAHGLIDEVRSLLPYRQLSALQTVGYREVFGYLDGEYDYVEMVRLLKRNSRRYAKRQLTWFRNQGNYRWFRAEEYDMILTYVREMIT